MIVDAEAAAAAAAADTKLEKIDRDEHSIGMGLAGWLVLTSICQNGSRECVFFVALDTNFALSEELTLNL